jgi:ferric-dicitrate binding protein FerR (iron transport regulator)
VYNELTGQYRIEPVEAFEATAWQRGELLFRSATMAEIFNALERRYDVSFQYKPAMFDDDKYNFRFKKESSLSDILDVLKEVAGNFSYRQSGDSYYID